MEEPTGNSVRAKGKRFIGEEDVSRRQKSNEGHSTISASSTTPVRILIDEHELYNEIGGNETKIPSPIIEEPIQERIPTKVVEPENPKLEGGFQDGITSVLKGVEDNFDDSGMEQSTIPDWLREKMKVKVPEEVHQEDNTTLLLSELNKSNKRRPSKPAKKFSLIQRSSVGFRSDQVAVPKVDKARDNITPEEYEITTISLGKTTKIQEVQEFDDSCNTLQER